MEDPVATAEAQAEKFCPQCGRSTVPLPVPHTSAECDHCDRTVHFIRPGKDGEGIQIAAGERFTIPSGWINLSLRPSAQGTMSRPGLQWLMNQYFVGRAPSTEEDILQFIEEAEKEFDSYLKSTDAAKGLNLETEVDLATFIKKLEHDRQSHDWYMLSAALCCAGIKWSIENAKPQRAAWAGYMLGTMRGLGIVSEPLFEETIWRGYQANDVVFEADAAVSNRSPAELEALGKLEPLFFRFDDSTLVALVHSGLPIGPKINVKHLSEEVLQSLAKHHLVVRERERQEQKQAIKDKLDEERTRQQDRRDDIELRIKWAGVGVAIAGALAGSAKLFF